MSPDNLDAIEARLSNAQAEDRYQVGAYTSTILESDVPALVAEVRLLQTELEGPVCFCDKCAGGITSRTMNMATGHLVCGECDRSKA